MLPYESRNCATNSDSAPCCTLNISSGGGFNRAAKKATMPRLKNRKREHFAVEVASMTPPDRAYLLAGFKDSKWSPYNASKLANAPAVAARIAELQREFAERAQLHVEYLQRLLLPLVEA